jgi:hypothetical protein
MLDYAMGTLEAARRSGPSASVPRQDRRGVQGLAGQPAKLRHLVHQKAIRIDGDRAWNTGLWWEMTNGGPEGPAGDAFVRHLRGRAGPRRRALAVQAAQDLQRVPGGTPCGPGNPVRAMEDEPMIDFAGRTAFVTGGANGVGIGIVRNLLNEGAKVAIADIRQDAIDAALASLDNREVMGVSST